MNVLMIGATGAVGTEVARALMDDITARKLTLLGRRSYEASVDERIQQHTIDLFGSSNYRDILPGHDVAICTLGVGQPSRMSKQDFVRIDKQLVVEFATECKAVGVAHFQLLCSVAADSNSRSFYLRTKGELQDELKALSFDRLSIFQPSMMLTDHNRYGLMQALTLSLWPLLGRLLIGRMRKYRGIHVADLGRAIASNIRTPGTGVEELQWNDFVRIASADRSNSL